MDQGYRFLKKTEYEPLLEDLAISESDYVSALQEVINIFPFKSSLEYYRATSGPLTHFDLVPYSNQRLYYHPVPILLNVPPTVGILSQLLYLGLALRDVKNAIGKTKAFKNLISLKLYRGALFEIEVGAELVRTGLKPNYQTTSPDYIIPELPVGIEVTMRDVPLSRAVAERLLIRLSPLNFKRLSVELTIREEHDIEELVDAIIKDIERLLNAGDVELIKRYYSVRHDFTPSENRRASITFGKYGYEDKLSELITDRLKDKEKQIRKHRTGTEMKYIAALDIRSLLALPLEPESEYERQLAEGNRPYYDRLRVFRKEVFIACQTFVAKSPLIKGVLLWERKRTKTTADEVYRRNSISLVTANQTTEIDKRTLSRELVKFSR